MSVAVGFSGEGIALTFAAFPDEPETDESLASLAEVHSPPVVVVVGLSSAGLLDQTVGKIGLTSSSVTQPCLLATRSAAVSRGWV